MKEEVLVRYRVKSGQVRYNKETYGPGKIIKAPPGKFSDFEVECLDKEPDLEALEKEPGADFEIKAGKGVGRFNVVDASTGEPFNDKELRKDEAETMLADLTGGKAKSDGDE